MEQARYVKRFGSVAMFNGFIIMGHFIKAMQIQVKNAPKHNRNQMRVEKKRKANQKATIRLCIITRTSYDLRSYGIRVVVLFHEDLAPRAQYPQFFT